MSDTLANELLNNQIFNGFDVLNYSIVDMDSNGGAGKVTIKNKILLDNQRYAQTALTAVRHANNKDWWLVKADCWHHQYQLFLVKEDTILGPYYHNITDTANYCSTYSQIYFSEDGTKFASSIYGKINGSSYKNYNRADIYDFNRATGQFTYKNFYEAPLDSTSYQWQDGKAGICFSPDSKLLYMSTWYNIFQFDLSDTNPYSATHIHGPDTTLDAFASYHIMAYGPDGKLYIGNFDAMQNYMSYIDKPNIKGTGCNFKAHGIWQPYTFLSNPPNMPSYGLGQVGTMPLATSILEEGREVLEVYPNPSFSKFQIRCKNPSSKKELYNSVGQLIMSTKENEIDVSRFSKGVYYLKVENETKKVIVE